jgi:hypothetical protein
MTYRFGIARHRLRLHGWSVRCFVVVAAAAQVVVLPERADAGTYTVTGCRTGWVPDVRNTTADVGPAANDRCDQSGVSMLSAVKSRDVV